jgi:tripartite-type tricarboxylate transporter receptor subunit TctC
MGEAQQGCQYQGRLIAGDCRSRWRDDVELARRNFLSLAAGAAALPIASRYACAEAYPARAVHVLVGFSPGSASDVIVRLMAQRLSEQLGQPFVVENRVGAATNLAAEQVTRATADGYTLLLATSTNAVNATLYRNLNFNFATDIAPVALIDLVPYVLEVTPSLPAKTLPEFIAYTKANPGKINMASNGVGSGPHVAGELFKMMAGVDLVHVPYTGNPYSDLIAGQVQMMFSPIPASISYVRSGQLRPLAVGSTSRIAVLPDVPTVAETLPGYDASGWHGLGAPKATPPDIIAALNKAVNADLAEAAFKDKLANLGGVPAPMTAAEFTKFIADETQKWAKVNKFADIHAD